MKNANELLYNRLCGFWSSEFYSLLCSKFNLKKTIARQILFDLNRKGYIELVSRSPKGSKFYVKSVKRMVENSCPFSKNHDWEQSFWNSEYFCTLCGLIRWRD